MEMTANYRLLQGVARLFLQQIVRIEVSGIEHVPASGPCILLPNHQSALDPLLVQGICPRMVSTMTKSTQFASPIFRFLLRHGEAFPVRRYKTDPQAVRTLLRKLGEGRAVCLYPEGERSWDGTLQPLRRGAIRAILRANVPVVPVGIQGMYDVWPRWRGVPRLGLPVSLRFGQAIHFGDLRDRPEREAAVAYATDRIRRALLELSGEGLRFQRNSTEAGQLLPPSHPLPSRVDDPRSSR